MMKNKKGVAIPSVIMFLGSIVIVSISLINFGMSLNNIEGIRADIETVDKVVFRERIINFYLEEIFEEMEIERLAGSFKEKLEELKINEEYPVRGLEQIEGQLADSNFIVGNREVVLTLNIVIEEFGDNVDVRYVYEKKLERFINEKE
ncbi:hypothetical protein CMI42_06035 [Candidatus Pacearchaeota archaeon]|nr:hypothetical protein [Candidatus Pacearchaeota archaeon]